MNENSTKNTPLEAFIFLFFVFSIIIFALYKYGGNNKTITNENPSLQRELTEEEGVQLLKNESGSELYSDYIDKIFEAKNKGETISGETISKEFQNDIVTRTNLPETKVNLNFVSSAYSKANYVKEVDRVFAEFKKAEGFGESKIFNDQITADGTLIPLSDYDRERLLKHKNSYFKLIENVKNIETPEFYTKNSENIISGLYKIQYIIDKVVEENDAKIYPLWINKYTETVFDILAERYVK